MFRDEGTRSKRGHVPLHHRFTFIPLLRMDYFSDDVKQSIYEATVLYETQGGVKARHGRTPGILWKRDMIVLIRPNEDTRTAGTSKSTVAHRGHMAYIVEEMGHPATWLTIEVIGCGATIKARTGSLLITGLWRLPIKKGPRMKRVICSHPK